MQDKHIDKQKQSKSDNQAVQAICQDLPNDAPEHYWAWRNAPKSIPSQYEYCMSCGRINATEWLTTEQLVILERLQKQIIGSSREYHEHDLVSINYEKGFKTAKEAIQQQIDKIGGEE